MHQVTVIVVEDTNFSLGEMGLPASRQGFEFGLIEVSPYPWVWNQDVFEKFADRFRNLHGWALIFFDLALGHCCLNDERKRELKEFLLQGGFQLPYDLNLANGLYLAMTALRNTNWQGLLVIASGQITGQFRSALMTSLSTHASSADQGVFALDNYLHEKPREKTEMAIAEFLHRYMDDLSWWLSPPNPQRLERLHWFDAKRAHSSGQTYSKHLAAVCSRFPVWTREDMDVAAKALTHTASEHLDEGDKIIPWECLKEFFPSLESDLTPQRRIVLPVRPGLVFLVAARRFFETIDKKLSGCYRLMQLDNGHIALVLRNSEGPWHEVLWKAFVHAANRGDSAPELVDAMAARLPPPEWIDRDAPPFLYTILDRKAFEIAAAVGALRWFAYPWVSREYVGIAWKLSL